MTYNNLDSVHAVMQIRDEHYIEGKWVDCKSAIPISEMKVLQQEAAAASSQSV